MITLSQHLLHWNSSVMIDEEDRRSFLEERILEKYDVEDPDNWEDEFEHNQ